MAEHPIYKALGQSNEILGCDRELFLLNLLMGLALPLISVDLVVTIACAVVCLFNWFLLHQMGARDIMMRKVFVRQLKYQPYYLAQGSIHSIKLKNYQK